VTLDLGRLSAAIGAMGNHLAANHAVGEERAAQARELLATADQGALAAAAEAQGGSVRPVEPPSARYAEPPRLTDYQVLGTDGSDIEPDRHGPALCYVINLGWAVIQYGANPRATLASQPELYFRPEDLYVRDTHEPRRQAPIQGTRLGAKRAVAEMERLADLAASPPTPPNAGGSRDVGVSLRAPDHTADARRNYLSFSSPPALERSGGATGPEETIPRVALSDGLLLLGNYWEGPEGFVRDYFVGLFRAALERLQALDVPVAAYISRPRGADVIGLLRLDPRHQAGCAWCRKEGRDRAECTLEGLADRTLFVNLAPGERSALFESRALAQHYPADLLPRFFYLNVGREVARVELPAWAAARPALVDRVQAVLLDQCRRGQGYPVALARAHEQAVIGGAERQRFNELVARALVARGLRDHPSEKQASKLARAV
jgi:hypothetical protein